MPEGNYYRGERHETLNGISAQFFRNNSGDFLLIESGKLTISVPIPIIEAAMSGEWEADSLDRAARQGRFR